MILEETEELFSQLSEAGYEPRICENDIPTFLNPVHCGPATEIGDVCSRDDEWYSRDLIERNQKFKITAIGDSMQDAGINAGDDLVIQKGVTPMDGDILLVNILDKFSVKAFCEDEDGQHYLGYYDAGAAMLKKLPSNSQKLP